MIFEHRGIDGNKKVMRGGPCRPKRQILVDTRGRGYGKSEFTQPICMIAPLGWVCWMGCARCCPGLAKLGPTSPTEAPSAGPLSRSNSFRGARPGARHQGLRCAAQEMGRGKNVCMAQFFQNDGHRLRTYRGEFAILLDFN
jgi:hypothetical protein